MKPTPTPSKKRRLATAYLPGQLDEPSWYLNEISGTSDSRRLYGLICPKVYMSESSTLDAITYNEFLGESNPIIASRCGTRGLAYVCINQETAREADEINGQGKPKSRVAK